MTKAPPVDKKTNLRVHVAAAGRCSFLGCLAYVLEEPLTKNPTKLSNVAHIVGESVNGPRGNDPMPLADRAQFENLMLMCATHHAEIDKPENWERYPKDTLLAWKAKHEAHMRLQTGIPVTAKTYALRFFGQIRGNRFAISDPEIRQAVFQLEERHVGEPIFDIDFIGVKDDDTTSYWDIGKQKVERVLREELFPKIERREIDRLSIFALARIPLLTYLGYQLGDKVPISLYQKHKDSGEEWVWPSNEPEINFEPIPHDRGVTNQTLAIFVSLSGGDIEKVKKVTDAGIIYEIRPVGDTPRLTLLRNSKTLENFRRCYRDLLSIIEAQHKSANKIDCFIAAPAPVALICGRELRAEVPKMVVYDLINGSYLPILTLNDGQAA